MRKMYLGDGVYAEFSNGDIHLTTEDGIQVTNRIVLEPEVLAALLRFVERLRREHEVKNNGND